jgi:hypothetical protein
MAIAILRGTKVLQNEQVTQNTTNNWAINLAMLKQERANDRAELPATPLDVVATPVIAPQKQVKSKRISKSK